MVDKNQAVIEFLIDCPAIKDNPLFFQFLDAKKDNKQLVTIANDVAVNRPYIDGSVLKRYTFTIVDYKAVINNAIVKDATHITEDRNVKYMLDVQGIIDWITEQNELRNYPNFGTECEIDDMIALTDIPSLNGVDTNVAPPLAKYNVSIQIRYIDKTKKLWK